MCAYKQGQGKPKWKDMKGCVHVNKDKENPSGKIQRGPKSKPKPKLKVEEEGLKKSLKYVVCQARK